MELSNLAVIHTYFYTHYIINGDEETIIRNEKRKGHFKKSILSPNVVYKYIIPIYFYSRLVGTCLMQNSITLRLYV